LAVFEIDRDVGVMTLVEIAEGCELEELRQKTGAPFQLSRKLKTF
jgi:acyl CoA:acetate/3-ketoacid CoA transferase beta subunit